MEKILNLLQALVIGVVLVLFSMGKGAHGVFIILFLAIPILRLVFSSQFRTKVLHKAQEYFKNPTTLGSVFWLICFPALFLTLVNGIGISSNDNYPVIMSTASLLTEGNLELSEYTPAPRSAGRDYCKEGLQNPYYIRCTVDGVRSAYPLGMVLAMLPTFTLAKLLGQDLYNADHQWRLSKWTASLVSAASLALFFLIACRWVAVPVAFFVTYFLMMGSTFASIISQGPWSHDGVVLGILLILYFELNRTTLSEKGRVVLYAFCAAWIFSCRLNSVALLIPLGFLLLYRRGWAFCLSAGLLTVLIYLPLGLYYQNIYGTFFGPQMVMGASTDIKANPVWGTLGILFSPAHGLFPYQPWLLLLLFYINKSVRNSLANSTGRGLILFFGAAIVFHILIISQWWCWWGGTWGSRLMSEIVPLLGFLVLFPVEYILVQYKKNGRKFMYGLLGFSFLFHAPHLFMFASNWNGDPLVGDLEGEARMWDWRSPPFLYPILKKIRPRK